MKTRQFAFHDNVKPNPPDLLNGKTSKEFLDYYFSFQGYSPYKTSLLYDGVVRLGGWEFDFSDDLREFIISQHGNLGRVFAPNRTAVRKAISGRLTILAETDRSKAKHSE